MIINNDKQNKMMPNLNKKKKKKQLTRITNEKKKHYMFTTPLNIY